jgi:hypothetical protein
MMTVEQLAAEAATLGVALCREPACPLHGPHYHPEPDRNAPKMRSAINRDGLVVFTVPARAMP